MQRELQEPQEELAIQVVLQVQQEYDAQGNFPCLQGRKLCTIMDTLTQWEPHSMLAATFSGRHTACKDILYSSLLLTHKTSNNKDNQSVGVGVKKVDPNKRVPTPSSRDSPENIDDIAKAEFYNPKAGQVQVPHTSDFATQCRTWCSQ
ncbi:hypothetical protein Tco_0040489 [Tanacetum coccineum]